MLVLLSFLKDTVATGPRPSHVLISVNATSTCSAETWLPFQPPLPSYPLMTTAHPKSGLSLVSLPPVSLLPTVCHKAPQTALSRPWICSHHSPVASNNPQPLFIHLPAAPAHSPRPHSSARPLPQLPQILCTSVPLLLALLSLLPWKMSLTSSTPLPDEALIHAAVWAHHVGSELP